jgi:hypothetical protein
MALGRELGIGKSSLRYHNGRQPSGREANVQPYSVTNMARYWGQGVAGYGNDLKDAVNAGGPRVAVAGNPLGLAGQGSGRASAPGQKAGGAAKSATGGRSSASNPLGI